MYKYKLLDWGLFSLVILLIGWESMLIVDTFVLDEWCIPAKVSIVHWIVEPALDKIIFAHDGETFVAGDTTLFDGISDGDTVTVCAYSGKIFGYVRKVEVKK